MVKIYNKSQNWAMDRFMLFISGCCCYCRVLLTTIRSNTDFKTQIMRVTFDSAHQKCATSNTASTVIVCYTCLYLNMCWYTGHVHSPYGK